MYTLYWRRLRVVYVVNRPLGPILVHLVTGTCSPWIKQADREADHSPQYGVEVRNEWSCTSTPPICLHGVRRINFKFVFTLFYLNYVRTLKSKLKVNCRRFLLFACQVYCNYNI
jgi:hypothetical protein